MQSFTSEDTLTAKLSTCKVLKASPHHIITVVLENPRNQLLFHTSVPLEDYIPQSAQLFTNNTGLWHDRRGTSYLKISLTIAVCGHLQSRISKWATLRACTPAWMLPSAPTPPAGYPSGWTRRSRWVITGIPRYLGRARRNGCWPPGDPEVLWGRGVSAGGGLALEREGGRASTQALPDAEWHAAGSEAVHLEE